MQSRAIHTSGFFKNEAKPPPPGSEIFTLQRVRVLSGRFGNHNRSVPPVSQPQRAHVAGKQVVFTKKVLWRGPEGSAPQTWRRERPLHGSHFGRAIGWSWPIGDGQPVLEFSMVA